MKRIVSLILILLFCLSQLPIALASSEVEEVVPVDETESESSSEFVIEPFYEETDKRIDTDGVANNDEKHSLDGAVSGKCSYNPADTLIWTLEDGIITISGDGSMSDYWLDEVPWAEYRDEIFSVIVEPGANNIGKNAFSGCTNLRSVELGNTVKIIGYSAFSGCTSLTDIKLSEYVQTLYNHAFAGCTSLTSISIPDSVMTINENVFKDCTSLTDINVDRYNTRYTSIDGVLFDKDGSELILYPMGKTGDYVVPQGVVTISSNAFTDCKKMTGITFPDSLNKIEYNAFSGCSGLKDLVFPDSVTSIGVNAFSGCTGLVSITLSKGLTSLQDDVFAGCSNLDYIEIPGNINNIYKGAFSGCVNL